MHSIMDDMIEKNASAFIRDIEAVVFKTNSSIQTVS